MNQQKSLQETMKVYLRGEFSVNLAILLLANGQMTSEEIIKLNLLRFNNESLKKQFLSAQFDLEKHKIRPVQEAHLEESNISAQERIFEQVFQAMRGQLRVGLNEEDNYYINLNLIQRFASLVTSKKQEALKNTQLYRQSHQMAQRDYLETLIKEILQVLQITASEEITQKVLNNQAFITCYPHFKQNYQAKSKFQLILKNCKTYKQFRKWGGNDSKPIKNQFERTLLQNLKFTESINLQIFNELVQDPLSHIVLNHPQLTLNQKHDFMSSSLFTEGILLKYLDNVMYDQSLQYQCYEEMEKIVEMMETQQIPPLTEIINKIVSYNIYDLLKVTRLKEKKNKIFFFILQNCPSYYQAYKSIYLRKEKAESLKFNSQARLKLKIRNCLMEAKLSFTNWQECENAFLVSNFNIIDKYQLGFSEKYVLRKFVSDELKPYYRKRQAPETYQERIHKNMVQGILQLQFQEDHNFVRIQDVIKRIINNNDIEGKTVVDDFNNRQFRQLSQYLSKNDDLKKFFANKKIDIEQVKYQKGLQIEKYIYEINQELKIDVSMQHVNQFINEYLQEFKIPLKHQKFICDINKLQAKYRLQAEVQTARNKVNVIQGVNHVVLLSPEEIKMQKQQLLDQFVKFITTNYNQKSDIFNIMTSKFESKEKQFADILISQNYQLNKESIQKIFGINGFLANKLLIQLSDTQIKQAFAPFFNRYRALANQPSSTQVNSAILSRVNPESLPIFFQRDENKVKKFMQGFYREYNQVFPESVLAMIVEAKKETMSCEQMFEKMITENILNNDECSVYTICNSFQKRKLKAELTQQANSQFLQRKSNQYRELNG